MKHSKTPQRYRPAKAKRAQKSIPGAADWAALYAKPEDMRTLPFGIEPKGRP